MTHQTPSPVPSPRPVPPRPEVLAFLRDIKERPDDDTTRLILADWLDEQGDPRGQFLRLECQLAHLRPGDPDRDEIERQDHDLWVRNEAVWLGAWRQLAERWKVWRGLLQVTVVDLDFLDTVHASLEQNEAWAWVVALTLRLRHGESIARLVQSPFLAHLASLQIEFPHYVGEPLYREDVEALARSPHVSSLLRLALMYALMADDGLMALVSESACLQRLTHLHLPGNIFGPRSMRALAAATHLGGLQHLDLGINPLGPRGAEELAAALHFTSLSHLELHHTGLGDAGLVQLARAPLLRTVTTLGLAHNGLAGEGLAALASSPAATNLTALDLSDNPDLEGEAMRALAYSPHLAGLTTLELANNPRLGDLGVAVLASSPYWKNLRNLELDDTGLTSDAAQALVRSSWAGQPRRLGLSGNLIMDRGVRLLAGCSRMARLTSLDLGRNALGEEAAQALAQSPHLARLEVLLLHGNRIGAEGAGALADSPHFGCLRELNLRGNPIPRPARERLQRRFGSRVEVDG